MRSDDDPSIARPGVAHHRRHRQSRCVGSVGRRFGACERETGSCRRESGRYSACVRRTAVRLAGARRERSAHAERSTDRSSSDDHRCVQRNGARQHDQLCICPGRDCREHGLFRGASGARSLRDLRRRRQRSPIPRFQRRVARRGGGSGSISNRARPRALSGGWL